MNKNSLIEIILQFTTQTVSFRAESIISHINLGTFEKGFEVSRDEADFVDSYGKGTGIQILQQIETDLFKLGANVSFTKAWVGTDYVNFADNNS